jgi:hypothetical protein
MVRTSTRAVSPSREIWPDVGLTHQSPMRSFVAVGRSIEDWYYPLLLKQAFLNRKAALANYTNTAEKR